MSGIGYVPRVGGYCSYCHQTCDPDYLCNCCEWDQRERERERERERLDREDVDDGDWWYGG